MYLDEINFTKRSVLVRDWSRRNSNLAVDQKDIYTDYRSVIASMSEENGVGLISIHDSAITADDFVVYLKNLRRKHPKRPLALFMDQLAVHKTLLVKE